MKINRVTTSKTFLFISMLLVLLSSCGGKQDQGGGAAGGTQAPPTYQVFTVSLQSVTLHTSYPATLQGEQNIDIRPKVDGYVEKIYIDEGAVVKKGQLLFKLSAPQYQQTVDNSLAAINSAEADINTAQLQYNKAKPMVERGIISHYELESDQYALDVKKAALVQAKTALATARTNLGYTIITSPVNGVVGTIPYRIGSLITSTTTEPLTTVSNISKVFAYFSLNEKQLLDFSRTVKGSTLNDKLKNTPDVVLVLSDGSTYPENGRIETISGLINTSTGSASFRATFPNPVGLLRSGSSASVLIPQQLKDAILVPQRSAYELQGKHFVYVMDKNGLIKNTEIGIMELTAGQYYVVTGGLKAGDQVVYDGTTSLTDSARISPQIMAADSVYRDLDK